MDSFPFLLSLLGLRDVGNHVIKYRKGLKDLHVRGWVDLDGIESEAEGVHWVQNWGRVERRNSLTLVLSSTLGERSLRHNFLSRYLVLLFQS
jgi:hypothetical protein